MMLVPLGLWKPLTLAGLFFNLVGVILLFFYVLPKRSRTGGTLVSFQGSVPNQELIRLERRLDFLSTIGLWCVIIGIVMQGFGVWSSP
jgi:hypothetical protein